MDLILWRHAQAEEHGLKADRERQLTPLGHRQAEKMAALLKKHLPSDLTIYSSPAIRCQQTLAALDLPFTVSSKLNTESSVQDILMLTGWHSDSVDKRTILICSHQPLLGQTISTILSGQSRYWAVKKGSIWWLSSRNRGHDNNVWVRAVLTPAFFDTDEK